MARTIQDLYQLQALSLDIKIRMTQSRIRAWVDRFGLDQVAISFSGGKDSTVLLDICRSMYPDMKAVFFDTTLEYPEIREFVKTFENVEWIKPPMNFKQVVQEYGYPIISKEVSESISGARKYLLHLTKEMYGENALTNERTNERTNAPYRYYYDRITGQGQYKKLTNAHYCENLGGGTTTSIVKSEELANILNERMLAKSGGSNRRLAILLGMLTNDKEHPIKANIPDKDRSIFSQERYKFFLEAPFLVSNRCCNVFKKDLAHKYTKDTGRVFITAQMASESRLRTQKWLQNGCNGFNLNNPISNPMSFWVSSDCLLYIKSHNLPIASVYGDVVSDDEETGQLNFNDMCEMGMFDLGNVPLHTTGCDRTGCVGCLFGIQSEKKSRLKMIDEVSNPAIRDFLMRGGDFDTDGLFKPDDRGMGYYFILAWVNYAGNFNIYIPEYERYLKEYATPRIYEELERAKQIGKEERR